MWKYTERYLSQLDLKKRMEDDNIGYSDLDSDEKALHDFKFPKEYTNYELNGVVIHMGEANSGHYYSYIKNREKDDWFEFNDRHVSKFRPEDLDEAAFGGKARGRRRRFAGSSGNKTYNAYMLIYERKADIDTEEF